MIPLDNRKEHDLNPSAPSPPVPVALIGMGCMFPQAEDLARFWANIRKRVDAITEVPESHWRAADYHDDDPKAADRTYARRGGFLNAVDFPLLEFGIAPHSIEATDTTQLLGLLVARRALEDSGCLRDDAVARDRISVILGVTGTLELVIPLAARLGHPIWRRALEEAGVAQGIAADVIERIASSYVGWQEGSFPGLLGNVAAGRIANRLDLRGTNCVVDAACASSLGAVNLAMLELASGRCDVAVTGGLDTFNDIFMYMCFSKTPALSPTGNARPFDAEADGTILGEGLGVLVLKRLADARRDGDRVYAVIRSIGSSSDGAGQAVYAPSAAGQALALKHAYDLAGIAPRTVELVEAHGTGTRVGDSVELAALESVYEGGRSGGPWCALGSVKSQVGHTKAAAGAAGLIKAAMALYHKVLPPTTKVRRPIERLGDGSSPFYLNTECRPWLASPGQPRRAAVSAFGFGGSNFHCVLEEAEPEKPGIDWDGDVQILAFSGDRPADFEDALRPLEGLADWGQLRCLAALSRMHFRAAHRLRLLVVASRDEVNAGAVFATAKARLDSYWSDSASPAEGTAAGRARRGRVRTFMDDRPRPGSLAMLFPGQGSQYVGMLAELACQFPQMQASLCLLNELGEGLGNPLSGWIYPPPALEEAARHAQELALRDTRIAQPAIAAVSLGLLHILDHFGVRPDLTAGHSFGELTALRAGGRLSDRSLAFLAHRRGALLAECGAQSGSGAMLAVFAPLDEVRAVLRDHALGLVIANKNAPRQCIVSGPASEVKRSRKILGDRRIATAAVAVSGAFHSEALTHAEAGLRQTLDSIELASSTIPIFANATAAPYPDDPDSCRALLAGQLVRPVEFVSQIEAMYRMGARTFLEVGPDAKLTALVGAILEGKPHVALAVDATRGGSGNMLDLACALASLSALGYAVNLSRWDGGDHGYPTAEQKAGLTVSICGANARPKRPAAELARTEIPPLDQERIADLQQPVDERPRPFSIASDLDATGSSHFLGRGDGEINRPMDSGDGTKTPHANGQAWWHQPVPRPVAEQDEAPVSGRASRAPLEWDEGLSRALANTQDSLIALQRLAEQTAELHRQFLEGQEKTQQTFLRLVEHQHRLSLTAIGQAEAIRSRPVEHMGPGTRASLAGSTMPMPAIEGTSLPVPARGHPGATMDAGAPEGSSAAGSGPATAPTAPARAGSLAAILVEVVAEKTGYPAEVLDLDMQLDADLGIDSIKRVEIFSALQDRLPELPALKPEQVGSLRSLRSIVDVMNQARSGGAVPETQDAGRPEYLTDREGLVARVLLDAVAEKTGYPVEMLELDMKLDSDLGIDSIKRVEIFSSIQDRLAGVPALAPEQLGTLSTLRQIVGALSASTGAAAPTAAREAAGAVPHVDPDCLPDRPRKAQPSVVGAATENGWAHLGENGNGQAGARDVVLRRLHPRCRPLESPEDREAVRLRAGGTIWIVADGSPLTAAVRSCLAGRGFDPVVVHLNAAKAPETAAPPCGLIVLAPREPDPETFLVRAFQLIRAAGPGLERSGALGGAALMTVARLDGNFGVNGLPWEMSPIAGGLAGIAKTAGHEWRGVACKAVDLDPAIEAGEQAAAAIVDELLARGPAEVGITPQGRIALELAAEPPRNGEPRRRSRLARGDVVLASGGARGITAEVAVALAESFQPRLIVLGRTPAPAPESSSLAALQTEAELTQALIKRSGRPLPPQQLGEESRRVLREREIRRNLARMTAAGSPAVYRSVDLRDSCAVRALVNQMRAEYGEIRGLIHGAGVLADRRITDQTDAQFDLVYDTKVKGLVQLFEAIDPESLEFLFLFSSSTARLGRVGQVAYATANEVLNKWAQRQARHLPHCRVVSYNWGPWAGGMVNAALRPMFEKEGLTLIPPAAGAGMVVEDAETAGSGSGLVEVVVLAEPARREEGACAIANGATATVSARGPAAGMAADRSLETVMRRTVDLASLSILASHVIDGNAVLPMALVVEWLAEGAAHRNPGLVVCGLDDVRLLKGVVLKDRQPATVDIRVGKTTRTDCGFIVPVELRGTLPNGRPAAHARADVILADRHAGSASRLAGGAGQRFPMTREEIYHSVLFHGPALQGIEQVEGWSERSIAGWVMTAPAPAEWIDRPLRSRWLTDPLAIDSAFQLVVLWCAERLGANSLPVGIGAYRQFRRSFPAGCVRVVVEIRSARDARAVADIEFLDASGDLVARLDAYECVIDRSLNQAFRRKHLVHGVHVIPS
jgi:acyl transferase domain-containing protein